MANSPHCDVDVCAAWFAGRMPDDWFAAPVIVRADKDEILVVGTLAAPTNVAEGQQREAALARISGFREDTRLERMRVAEGAQHYWQRSVSWVATCGEVEARFTTQTIPVMSRLRFDERAVLDTLIDSGVARSRSEALAWCVSQVGIHQEEWIGRLRGAMTEVERIRNEGPAL